MQNSQQQTQINSQVNQARMTCFLAMGFVCSCTVQLNRVKCTRSTAIMSIFINHYFEKWWVICGALLSILWVLWFIVQICSYKLLLMLVLFFRRARPSRFVCKVAICLIWIVSLAFAVPIAIALRVVQITESISCKCYNKVDTRQQLSRIT